MKRIVVGADGSPGAANAMRWAARLAASHRAELIVMTGLVPTDSELAPERVESLLADQQESLERWASAARLDDVSVRTVVERGDPRPGILAVAEREGADLIVVGRIGTSAGPGILHIGSMAEWLAHHSNRPMAVVGGAVNLDTQSVLVGLDGSDGSRSALSWVATLAEVRPDVRIVAVAVDYGWTSSEPPNGWRSALEKRIREDYAVELTGAGVDYVAMAQRGSNVADVLLQTAKDERTDIIVVGARGLGGFTDLRVGGVALKTLHRADRPVVVVPIG